MRYGTRYIIKKFEIKQCYFGMCDRMRQKHRRRGA